MLCLLIRLAHILSGLFIQVLLLVIFTGQIVYSQDDDHPTWTERYVDDSASLGGNGTYANPWKTFGEIQINQEWVRVNIRAATYTIPDLDTAFLLITNKTGVMIRKDPDSPGDVIIDGGDSIKYGVICIEEPNQTTSSITLDGIQFKNLTKHGIYVSANSPQSVYNFAVTNCKFDLIGSNDDSIVVSYAPIRVRGTEFLRITNNDVTSAKQVTGQTDGMQINRCSDIFIENNDLKVYNDSSTSHIDVIQIFECTNATIKSNNMRYSGGDSVRSGILIDATGGDIEIFNNVIHSSERDNLIGIHIEPATSTALIYNNTLVCDGNPGHLISIANDNHSAPHNIFRIKNNILYKQGAGTGNNTVSIYFDSTILYQNIDSNQINYNSHYNGNDTTAHIQFGGQTTVTYWTIETEGIYGNQLFNMQDSSYSLLYNSPCKNEGASFYSLISSDKKGNKRPYWTDKAFDIGAYELPDAHIKFGKTTTENYTSNLDAMGPIFERNDSSWDVTSNSGLTNLSFTTNDHCADTNKVFWDGVNFNWLNQGTPGDTNSPAGIGLYRIQLQDSVSKYFYLDTRDANYSVTYNPNIHIQYNGTDGLYEYININTPIDISNGSVIRAWEILNQTPSYNSIWTNILAVYSKLNTSTQKMEPCLDWRPYSGFTPTGYKIYYRVAGLSSFNFLTSVGSNVYSYQHTGMAIGENYDLEYYVKAYNSTDSIQTNIVSIGVRGPYHKEASDISECSYNLLQNYPNPFNPSTVIRYSVADPGLVSLKIYDILGREVKTLVNEVKDVGSYQVMFNPTDLASGIYIYQLRVNNYSSVKKMQYIK